MSTKVETAVSRALNIPELLQIIVGHVACWKWREVQPADTTSLVNLAQVNKYFSPIALAHLWRNVESSRRLIYIWNADLLSDQVELDPTECTGNTERLVYYSGFIRSLDLDDRSWDKLATILKLVLSQHPDLFGSVQTLVLPKQATQGVNDLFPILLHPALTKLRVDTQDADLKTTYASIRRCTDLVDFSDWGDELLPEAIQEIVVPTLQKLSRLQSIFLPVALRSALIFLNNLSTFASLLTLHLQIVHDPPEPEAIPAVVPTPKNGAYLKKLIITSGHGELMVSAARHCAQNSIVVDEFEFTRSPLAGESVEFVMETIALAWPHLKKCRYSEPDYGRNRSWCQPIMISHLVVLPAYLQPILRLDTLQSLKIEPFSHVAVDTDFLDALAKACPLLRSCVICTDKRMCLLDTEEVVWTITMRDVVQFALKMPSMRNLGIAFDGRKSSDPNPHAILEGASATMEEIHVNVSAVDDADYATEMLSRAFPNLRLMWWVYKHNIDTGLKECLRLPEADRNIWAEVEKRLRLEIIE